MILITETTSTGPEPWVYFVGSAGAVLVFLAGIAFSPLTKSREALALEHRHNRLRLQELAHDAMRKLAKSPTRAFNSTSTAHERHKARPFSDLLTKVRYDLTPTDRAVFVRFNQALTTMDQSANATEHAANRAIVYERYLDLQRPWRRWKNRRAALQEALPKVERKQFLNTDASQSEA